MLGGISAAGFFVGQIIEPALEVLFYRESFAAVNPPVRWQLFGEFAAAWLAGGFAVLAASRLLRPPIPTSS